MVEAVRETTETRCKYQWYDLLRAHELLFLKRETESQSRLENTLVARQQITVRKTVKKKKKKRTSGREV